MPHQLLNHSNKTISHHKKTDIFLKTIIPIHSYRFIYCIFDRYRKQFLMTANKILNNVK